MPVQRISVQPKIADARAEVKKRQFKNLGLSVSKVELADCYTIDAGIAKQKQKKALRLLANNLVESASLQLKPRGKFTWLVEIGFLPGVTDNVGSTTRETLADGLNYKFKNGENVYSSLVLFLSGKLSPAAAQKAADSLYNPLIQRATVLSAKQFYKSGLPLSLPTVKLTAKPEVLTVNLNLAHVELADLGKFGILDAAGKRRGPLGLDLASLLAIKNYFAKQGRQPTDVELESLAQTWSEHCKHIIFFSPIDEIKRGLYKHYIKRATEKIIAKKNKKDFCVSVFTDNSGAIAFDDDFLITHKVETHNTPSALDPFGGALTGIVGVNRDALGFGLGAKPIANFYGFCLAEPRDTSELFRDPAKKQKMLSARRTLDGVVAGINSGGNQSGIPTPLGFLYFDKSYRGKPLVFAGTAGIIPRKSAGRVAHKKAARPGDYIVMIGGRVGKDGIHGATFSSEGLDPHSPATAVQIGDPITQKKFSDALTREARDQGLYNSITDNGAGGLSSSVGEMAKESGGCLVFLDKVPLKYAGLNPWEIWISESQERMTLAVPPETWKKFLRLMKRRGVEATAIGKFTNSGRCQVKYGSNMVMDVSLDFLHNGVPLKHLKTQQYKTVGNSFPLRQGFGGQVKLFPTPRRKQNFNHLIKSLLERSNICSYEFISKQYDHEVQASSVTKPLQGRGRVGSDAAVLRPRLDSQKGVVLSYGLYPAYSEIDAYRMAACGIDTAIRAAVCAGANVDRLALLDNFCWCSPGDPGRLWQLKQAAAACFDYAVAFGTPFISGKDSMHNDFHGFDSNGLINISVLPTLLISAIGVIPDIKKSLTIDAKTSGDGIYILGETGNELAGSEFAAMMGKNVQDGNVPKVSAKKNLGLYRNFYKAAQNDLVSSAISLSRGGLAAALCKMCVAGNLGAEINLAKIPGSAKQAAELLFSESQGRILVSVDANRQPAFEQIMKKSIFGKIGNIGGKNIIVNGGKKNIVSIPVEAAEWSYKSTFKDY